MGHYAVTPLYGLYFLIWSLLALVYPVLLDPLIIASIGGGILAGLVMGIITVRFRLKQLEMRGEIRLSYQTILIAIIAIAAFIYLSPILAPLPLDEAFAIGKITYGAAAGFWGPTWFFFRRWERQHHKEIVSAGFLSTRIYAEDANH